MYKLDILLHTLLSYTKFDIVKYADDRNLGIGNFTGK